MSEQNHQGGCLCGAVQYAFTADPVAASIAIAPTVKKRPAVALLRCLV